MNKKSHAKIGQLKKQALSSLKGKWGIAVIATLIFNIVMFFPTGLNYTVSFNETFDMFTQLANGGALNNFENAAQVNRSAFASILPFLIFAYDLLLTGAFTYGLVSLFLNLIRNNNGQIEDIFTGFKNYGRTFVINLLVSIFQIFWSLLWVIPYIIAIVIIVFMFLGGRASENMIGGIIIIAILTLILSITLAIFMNRYALVYYIAHDDRDISASDAIKKSIELMKGNKVRLFLLQLSFIGWFILGTILLLIPLLWATSYLSATTAAFYEDIIKETDQEQSLITE